MNFFRCRPKFISQDGNLVFESAKDRNISFILKGNGKTLVNGIDLGAVATRLSTNYIGNRGQQVRDMPRLLARVRTMEGQINGPNGIIRRLNLLQGNR